MSWKCTVLLWQSDTRLCSGRYWKRIMIMCLDIGGERMSVNERIKQYLEEHGIKQAFLVKKTGLNKQIISSILNQNRKLTAEELGTIANALGVDANIFLE